MAPSDYWNVAAAVIVSLGGGGAIVLALSSFLGKVWASRILEAERAKYAKDLESTRATYAGELEQLKSQLDAARRATQAGLDRAVYIHRLHFEAEFAATKDIWSRLSTVRAKMKNVRPVSRLTPPGETEEQELDRTFPLFVEAKNAFVNAVDTQSPFLPRDYYSKFDEIIKILNLEYFDVATEKPGREWRLRGKHNFEELCKLAADFSDMIRERMEHLVLFPS